MSHPTSSTDHELVHHTHTKSLLGVIWESSPSAGMLLAGGRKPENPEGHMENTVVTRAQDRSRENNYPLSKKAVMLLSETWCVML